MSADRRTQETPGWPTQSELRKLRKLPGESGNYIDIDTSHLGFDHECRSCGQHGTAAVFAVAGVVRFKITCTCGNESTTIVGVTPEGGAVAWEQSSGAAPVLDRT